MPTEFAAVSAGHPVGERQRQAASATDAATTVPQPITVATAANRFWPRA